MQSTAATAVDDYLDGLSELDILDSKWYGVLDYVHSYPIRVHCGCGAETKIMNSEMVGAKCPKCGILLFPKLTGRDLK